MRGISRRPVLGTGVALLATVLTGCSGQPATPPASGPGPGVGEVTIGDDGVQQITLQTQDDYVFVPDAFTVAPGTVRVTVINVAERLTHNFRFRPDTGPEPIQAEIPLLAPGQEETIEFSAEQPGDYPFECSFHVQLGQVGTMTVQTQGT